MFYLNHGEQPFINKKDTANERINCAVGDGATNTPEKHGYHCKHQNRKIKAHRKTSISDPFHFTCFTLPQDQRVFKTKEFMVLF